MHNSTIILSLIGGVGLIFSLLIVLGLRALVPNKKLILIKMLIVVLGPILSLGSASLIAHNGLGLEETDTEELSYFTVNTIKSRSAFEDGLVEISWTDSNYQEQKVRAVLKSSLSEYNSKAIITEYTPNEFGKIFGMKKQYTVTYEQMTPEEIKEKEIRQGV